MISFTGKGGLSGDIWLASLMARIGPDDSLIFLNEIIPWVKASFDIEQIGERKYKSVVRVEGGEQAPKMSWADMRNFIFSLPIPGDTKRISLEILRSRQESEARGLGFSLSQMTYQGRDASDTLFDIVGGVYLWQIAGKPPVTLTGHLDIGYYPPPATKKLLEQIPTKTPGREKELTTPTGAALLSYCYKKEEVPKRDPDLIVLSGSKFALSGKTSWTESWHFF